MTRFVCSLVSCRKLVESTSHVLRYQQSFTIIQAWIPYSTTESPTVERRMRLFISGFRLARVE